MSLTISGCAGYSELWLPNEDTGELECVYRQKTWGSQHTHEYESPQGTKIKSDSKQKGLLDGFTGVSVGV